MSLGAAAIGGGLALASGIINNGMSYGMTQQARHENYHYGEMSAEAADRRTRELYADLQSPAALLQQYQEAGLSPSLMFSGGGGAGAQPSNGAQGAGASGINPQTYGVDLMHGAELALMEAQTRKTNAEADDIEGKTPEAESRIAKYWAEAGAQKAATKYTEAQTQWQLYENKLKKARTDDDIERAHAEAKIAINKQVSSLYEALHNEQIYRQFKDSYNERVKKHELENKEIAARILNIDADTLVKVEQGKEIEATINKINNDVYLEFMQMALNIKQYETEKDYKEAQKQYLQATIKNELKKINLDWRKFKLQFNLDVSEFISNTLFEIWHMNNETVSAVGELIPF